MRYVALGDSYSDEIHRLRTGRFASDDGLLTLAMAITRAHNGVDVTRGALTVREALAPLRERGAQLAIDDVGAGFANLRHILRLAPDLVKLDLSLTQEISRDPAREALASSLVSFADGVGASIVAEGISSDEDLTLLRALGVDYGQGFHLARPSALLH